jgi:deoxyribonuclease V
VSRTRVERWRPGRQARARLRPGLRGYRAGVPTWPQNEDELIAEQARIARLADSAEPWVPGDPEGLAVGGTFFAASTAARASRSVWAAAVVLERGATVGAAVVAGTAVAAYASGLLALREGSLLERAVRALDHQPDVLLVNATGRDHPRRAGLAVHLGYVLGLPTVGITDRPLLAEAPRQPSSERGSSTPLELEGRVVGAEVRTRRGARPVVVHAGWRTDPQTAASVVMASLGRGRTPEPLRRARHLARVARARDEGRVPPGTASPGARTIEVEGWSR